MGRTVGGPRPIFSEPTTLTNKIYNSPFMQDDDFPLMRSTAAVRVKFARTETASSEDSSITAVKRWLLSSVAAADFSAFTPVNTRRIAPFHTHSNRFCGKNQREIIRSLMPESQHIGGLNSEHISEHIYSNGHVHSV